MAEQTAAAVDCGMRTLDTMRTALQSMLGSHSAVPSSPSPVAVSCHSSVGRTTSLTGTTCSVQVSTSSDPESQCLVRKFMQA